MFRRSLLVNCSRGCQRPLGTKNGGQSRSFFFFCTLNILPVLLSLRSNKNAFWVTSSAKGNVTIVFFHCSLKNLYTFSAMKYLPTHLLFSDALWKKDCSASFWINHVWQIVAFEVLFENFETIMVEFCKNVSFDLKKRNQKKYFEK